MPIAGVELVEQGGPVSREAVQTLVRLSHRTWSIPVLAHLSRGGGGRVSGLAYALSAPRNSVNAALASLRELSIVQPVSGHGHPLRPEVVLTRAGHVAATQAARVMEALEALGAGSVVKRKWSLPALAALDAEGTRFSTLAERLASATDRAVTQVLRLLNDHDLLTRSVSPGWPPAVHYAPTAQAVPLMQAVRQLALDLTSIRR